MHSVLCQHAYEGAGYVNCRQHQLLLHSCGLLWMLINHTEPHVLASFAVSIFLHTSLLVDLSSFWPSAPAMQAMPRRGALLKGVLAGTLDRTAAECRELARAVVSREREACMVKQQLISMTAVRTSITRDNIRT
jgi:hypothetical protein